MLDFFLSVVMIGCKILVPHFILFSFSLVVVVRAFAPGRFGTTAETTETGARCMVGESSTRTGAVSGSVHRDMTWVTRSREWGGIGEWEVWWWWWRSLVMVREGRVVGEWEVWCWWPRSLVMVMEKFGAGEGKESWWWVRSLVLVTDKFGDGEGRESWWWLRSLVTVTEKFVDGQGREIWWWVRVSGKRELMVRVKMVAGDWEAWW